MLSEYQSMIESALKRGGMLPDAAIEAASAIANCAAALSHRGPMTLDYTPQKFRYITPERRKYQFPGLDALPTSPDFRPPIGEEPQYPEEFPEEPVNPRPEFGPSQPIPESPPNSSAYYTFVFNTTTGQQVQISPRWRKVITDVKIDPTTHKLLLECEYVWVLGFKREKAKELPASTVRALDGLKVNLAAKKLYGTINELTVLSSKPVDAVAIDITECT